MTIAQVPMWDRERSPYSSWGRIGSWIADGIEWNRKESYGKRQLFFVASFTLVDIPEGEP